MQNIIRKMLLSKSKNSEKPLNSKEFAMQMDEEDDLKIFKEKFVFPMKNAEKEYVETVDEIVYLCGHSLGLKPKTADEYVQRVLKSWADRAIDCQYYGYLNGVHCDIYPKEMMANMIGAKDSEVLIMNSLTVNLHLMLAAFYKPTPEKYKILVEHTAFPSDRYAVSSVLKLHGYTKDEALIQLKPRKGQYCLEYSDILSTIEKEGDEIALIMLPGIQYFTGQVTNMKDIVKVGHKKGCKVGLDLAHAVGNAELHLHDWEADFAVWCTYKYMSSGAGGIGGVFVHEKHTLPGNAMNYLQGWWGNKTETKFQFNEEFEPAEGASRFQLSNQCPLTIAVLMSSLEIFTEATMEKILKKQKLLLSYFDLLLEDELSSGKVMAIISPSDLEQRGSQISLLVNKNIPLAEIFSQVTKRGIVCDSRPPSLIRLSFMPLYNGFVDVYKCCHILREVVREYSR